MFKRDLVEEFAHRVRRFRIQTKLNFLMGSCASSHYPSKATRATFDFFSDPLFDSNVLRLIFDLCGTSCDLEQQYQAAYRAYRYGYAPCRKQQSKAVHEFACGALAGHRPSIQKLGLCYLSAFGVTDAPGFPKARQYFKAGAELGDLVSAYCLEIINALSTGDASLQPLLEKMAEFASENDTEAELMITSSGRRSSSLPPSRQSRLITQQRLRHRDRVETQHFLGLCFFYSSGLHIPNRPGALVLRSRVFRPYLDTRSGAMWFLRAAHGGHAPSQFELAQAYAQGRGVQRDERMAVRWLERSAAAEPCHPLAASELSRYYSGGRAYCPEDNRMAEKWTRAAGCEESCCSRGSGIDSQSEVDEIE